MGYGEQQMADLEATINAVDCDLVLIGTPIDLAKLLKIDKPAMRVTLRAGRGGQGGAGRPRSSGSSRAEAGTGPRFPPQAGQVHNAAWRRRSGTPATEGRAVLGKHRSEVLVVGRGPDGSLRRAPAGRGRRQGRPGGQALAHRRAQLRAGAAPALAAVAGEGRAGRDLCWSGATRWSGSRSGWTATKPAALDYSELGRRLPLRPCAAPEFAGGSARGPADPSTRSRSTGTTEWRAFVT